MFIYFTRFYSKFSVFKRLIFRCWTRFYLCDCSVVKNFVFILLLNDYDQWCLK